MLLVHVSFRTLYLSASIIKYGCKDMASCRTERLYKASCLSLNKSTMDVLFFFHFYGQMRDAKKTRDAANGKNAQQQGAN